MSAPRKNAGTLDDPIPLPEGVCKLTNIFCGCCTAESTTGLILAELERLEREEYIENDGLAAAIVDHCGLSEHGSSIRGGWLTPEGVAALAFFREHGADWRDKIVCVDAEGVHYGNVCG